MLLRMLALLGSLFFAGSVWAIEPETLFGAWTTVIDDAGQPDCGVFVEVFDDQGQIWGLLLGLQPASEVEPIYEGTWRVTPGDRIVLDPPDARAYASTVMLRGAGNLVIQRIEPGAPESVYYRCSPADTDLILGILAAKMR